jgi:peptide deformylase
VAVKKIFLFPDPLLTHACPPVDKISDATRQMVADLVDTLYESPGVGLAAPQIGALARAVVVDVTRPPPSGRPAAKGHGLLSLINPVIVQRTGEQSFREGCLSVPEFLATVKRAAWVRVEALTVDGNSLTIEADGFEAVALQHEIDHLDGVLFLDRVANLKTDLFRRKVVP